MNKMDVHQRFRKIKKELTRNHVEDLAKAIKASRHTASSILRGRSQPTFKALKSLFSAFPQLSERWVILGEGRMYKPDLGGKTTEQLLQAYNNQKGEIQKLKDELIELQRKVIELQKAPNR